MKRLRVDVEALQVESFVPTEPVRRGRGTVHGHAKASQETCGCTEGWVGCDPGSNYETCGMGCVPTVDVTGCNPTCVQWTCAIQDDCQGISAQGYFTCGYWSCDGTCP